MQKEVPSKQQQVFIFYLLETNSTRKKKKVSQINTVYSILLSAERFIKLTGKFILALNIQFS